MLIAMDTNEKRFSLADSHDREWLQMLRTTQTFHCPVCKEPVMMKLGEKKSYHFSHFQHSVCSNMSEPETPDHIQGKKDLYHWLVSQGHAPQLEWIIPSIQQRSDVGLIRFPNTLSFEFQCSSLPQDRLVQRNQGYLSESITPIWIWHEARLKVLAPNLYNMTLLEFTTRRFPFKQPPLTLEQRNKGFLTFYHPQSKRITFLYNLHPLTTRKIWGERYTESLHHLSLQDLLTPKLNFNSRIGWSTYWLKQKKIWRERVATRPQIFERQLLRLADTKKVVWNAFPSYVGLPLGDDWVIETSSHLWQGWICLQFLLNKPIGSSVLKKEVEAGVKQQIEQHLIQVHSNQSDWHRQIDAYLQGLCALGYLQAARGEVFFIKQDIHWSEPFLEDLLKEDERMLSRWIEKVK